MVIVLKSWLKPKIYLFTKQCLENRGIKINCKKINFKKKKKNSY